MPDKEHKEIEMGSKEHFDNIFDIIMTQGKAIEGLMEQVQVLEYKVEVLEIKVKKGISNA